MSLKTAGKMSFARVAVALLIGLAGCVTVWVVQPYNNFLLNNSFISDTYLPELVVAIVTLLAFTVNVVLYRFRRSWALNRGQLALIFGMLLVAAAPTQILRIYPHSLARGNREIAMSPTLSKVHQDMDLPEILYLDPIEFGADTPISEQFYTELDKDNPLPWGSWIGPLLGWGSLVGACWLMMVGLTLIVFPQWREKERMQFPLLEVQKVLIETPPPGTHVPPVFRNRLFWAACFVVMVIHAFNGLNHHANGAFPPFDLDWSLGRVFGQGLWRHMSHYAKTGKIFFTIVGITYFMPKRVGFSLWFTFMACQVYRMVGYGYFAPFYASTIDDYRNGASLGVVLMVLWLGRQHWLGVARAMIRPAASDADRRDRAAGWIFAAGCVAVLAWQLWAGITLLWALAFLVVAVGGCIVLARIVAETGIPFVRNYFGPQNLVALFPAKLTNAAAVYLGGFMDFLLTRASRVSAVVASLHGIALSSEGKPRRQIRMGTLFFALLLMGFVVCGAVHIYMGYHHPGSLDGQRTPLAAWGSNQISYVHRQLVSWEHGTIGQYSYSRPTFIFFGLVLGVALHLLCLASPNWPLHPVGLLMANTYYLGMMWGSVLLGWSLKAGILKYGGAKSYRLARPLFLGLILGEVFSAVIWALVPVILIAMGGHPADIGHITILPG